MATVALAHRINQITAHPHPSSERVSDSLDARALLAAPGSIRAASPDDLSLSSAHKSAELINVPTKDEPRKSCDRFDGSGELL
jgi:hypothetical protein